MTDLNETARGWQTGAGLEKMIWADQTMQNIASPQWLCNAMRSSRTWWEARDV